VSKSSLQEIEISNLEKQGLLKYFFINSFYGLAPSGIQAPLVKPATPSGRKLSNQTEATNQAILLLLKIYKNQTQLKT
jgi:hypothetical protein